MESAMWAFQPPAAPRVGDLYGMSGGARVGEPLALALEMDELEREERSLAASIQALVRRSAPEPIGVKFHRPDGRFSMDARASRGSSVAGGSGRGLPFPPSQFTVDESSTDSIGLHERADEEEEEEEEEEDEASPEEEDMDEDETDEDDVFTAEEDHDEDEDDEDRADPFARD